MVSDLMLGVLTVLGGAISGIIGILHSELRTMRAQQKELKEWYDTTIQLANRVERLGSDSFGGSGEYMGDALSGVIGRLTGHLMDAPGRVETDVVDAGEEFASDCEKARSFLRGERIRNSLSPHNEDSPDEQTPIESAIESAERVRIKSQTAKEDVGWL